MFLEKGDLSLFSFLGNGPSKASSHPFVFPLPPESCINIPAENSPPSLFYDDLLVKFDQILLKGDLLLCINHVDVVIVMFLSLHYGFHIKLKFFFIW